MTDYKQPFKGTGPSPENVGSSTAILTDEQARMAAFMARDSLAYTPRAEAAAALLASHREQAKALREWEALCDDTECSQCCEIRHRLREAHSDR